MRYTLLTTLVVAALGATVAFGEEARQLKEIRYPSAADNTPQPAMFYAPDTTDPVPLLVVLHTWSHDYTQNSDSAYGKWCMKKGWATIHPDFRGPNRRPEATGSELVVKDIVSSVDYAKSEANIDPRRIYLVGKSGGGYASLLMAGHHPEIWAGVSAWVPISDLAAWHAECTAAKRGYARQVAISCGGPPGASAKVDEQYRRRSPLSHLANAKAVPLDINAGIRDGHTGPVPISHALRAFNTVAAPEDRLTDAEIAHFVDKIEVPEHLRGPISDPSYGKFVPLFRRKSGRARLTIFDGDHTAVPEAALRWLHKQKKEG